MSHDITKLRAWRSQKQGLSAGATFANPAEVLNQVGWARSVGGTNPYQTLFARGIKTIDLMHEAVRNEQIYELPSARGCTYFVPRNDYSLALRVAKGFADAAAMNIARKYLGVTDKEVEKLCEAILVALKDGPLDPKALKEKLGDTVRNLGEEGKKRGQTTTLSLGLGNLQVAGEILRVPMPQRMDTQRYQYKIWKDRPSNLSKNRTDSFVELLHRYSSWIGPFTLGQFQWFSGLGVRETKEIFTAAELIDIGDGLWILPEELDAYEEFSAPTTPSIKLISSIDSLFLLGRNAFEFLDTQDLKVRTYSETGILEMGGIQELSSNAIVDRGRIIGLWEFDPERCKLIYRLFVDASIDINSEIERTEKLILDQLGDIRSFSLDSPKSRGPRIAALLHQ